jgi:hypothetical protein
MFPNISKIEGVDSLKISFLKDIEPKRRHYNEKRR